MNKYKWLIIILNLVLLLVYFNYSVVEKETLLKNGQPILLKLAPVDPRSLMQGDYMNLRYDIANNINAEKIPKRGYCVVKLDTKGIAEQVRFQKGPTPLRTGEHLIKYTSPNQWRINIGAESFFFQEGQSEKYDAAEYGGIKTDKDGNSLLIGLYDENLKLIK
ncbi:GDYXXLXY domain-containing protein [Chryseobacterium sp. BIGb0232]|uniref:GDYXXLXY domain-containing protein n=1 Tax=Chryseobacterium sp. BIGb0232 TaxID=2940598 RepID=UPI000F4A8D97|nr:GDYXXLXY domain-containing protein [Chryseobacterium sp. BIGb0232]MCS4303264.1 putative membrane-anchored protein [Chryseobacterium sp. BIGb0232]ROS11461.1 putative membrane-anchored protein [Chryseobacterium nakagawai]